VSASSEPRHPGSFARRLLICGALAAAGFAAYISLVPFDFHGVSRASLVEALPGALDWDVTSRANFLANVVLFIPIAFMAAGGLGLKRRGFLKVSAIVGGCLALSLAIESLQVFVSGRTPSIVDVGAQTAGVALGLVIWTVLGGETERWLVRGSRGGRLSNLHRLLTGYVGLRTIALLLPLDVTVSLSSLAEKYRAGGIRLAPFQDPANLGLIQDFTIDVILAVPIGVLAGVAWTGRHGRRSVPAAIALSSLYVGLLEVSQVFIMSRVAETTDVISGCLGAMLGVLAAVQLVPLPGTNPQASGRYIQALIGVGVVLAYVAYNWSPFDFVLSGEFARRRLEALNWVPFYSYYQNPEFKAAMDLVSKMCIAAPLGIAAAIGLSRGGPFLRLQWFLCGIGAVVLFTVVEIGQLLLPGRYPDITDILISALTFGAAAWAWPSSGDRQEVRIRVRPVAER
jgi:glycopeptide antibiotics resistance protein